MGTTIKINALAEEITMTKAAAKRASFFGTDEYKHLAQAKKDFPNFTVKISSPKGRENSNKGLTLDLMREIIKASKNDSKEAIEAFEKIVSGSKGTNHHFSEPKAHFLYEYPNWRGWLLKVEERRKEEAQSESAAAVDEQKHKWGFR